MKSKLNPVMTHPAQLCTASIWSKIRGLVKLLCWSPMLLLVIGLSACEPQGAAVAESGYATALVGDWQGTVGGERETISFRKDGSFTAKLFPTGFISTTLGQGTVGAIGGTWMLQGKVITLTVDSAENEQPANLATTSTIVVFNQNELVVTSASGETSTFLRAMN